MAKGQFASDPIPHDREATIVYTLDGVMYVPHYRFNDVYVGPGDRKGAVDAGPLYTPGQLLKAGARQDTYGLWPR